MMSQYDYNDFSDSLTLILWEGHEYFSAELHITTRLSPSDVQGQMIEGVLNESFGGNFTPVLFDGRRHAQLGRHLTNEATGTFIYMFEYRNRKTEEQIEQGVRFDPLLVRRAANTSGHDGIFFASREWSYYNPFRHVSDAAQEDDGFNRVYQALNSVFSSAPDLNVLVPVFRRANIEEGRRVVYNVQYFAEFSATAATINREARMVTGITVMVPWSWFLLAGLAAVLVIALILLLAKKGEGKVVPVNRIVVNRFGQITTRNVAGVPQGGVFPEFGPNNGRGNDGGNNDGGVFPGF